MGDKQSLLRRVIGSGREQLSALDPDSKKALVLDILVIFKSPGELLNFASTLKDDRLNYTGEKASLLDISDCGAVAVTFTYQGKFLVFKGRTVVQVYLQEDVPTRALEALCFYQRPEIIYFNDEDC